jgi:hypothetical protein
MCPPGRWAAENWRPCRQPLGNAGAQAPGAGAGGSPGACTMRAPAASPMEGSAPAPEAAAQRGARWAPAVAPRRGALGAGAALVSNGKAA